MRKNPIWISDDYTRSFGGKLNGFESRDEAMKEKKHLKAYLKGKSFYRHGFKTVELKEGEQIEVESGFNFRQPQIFKVEEIWTKKD